MRSEESGVRSVLHLPALRTPNSYCVARLAGKLTLSFHSTLHSSHFLSKDTERMRKRYQAMRVCASCSPHDLMPRKKPMAGRSAGAFPTFRPGRRSKIFQTPPLDQETDSEGGKESFLLECVALSCMLPDRADVTPVRLRTSRKTASGQNLS